MMSVNHVKGKKIKNIFIYTLSTCIWCKKTKKFFNDHGLEYDYIDADLVDDAEKAKIGKEMKKWCDNPSYPTVIIDNKECIQGFEPERLKEILGL